MLKFLAIIVLFIKGVSCTLLYPDQHILLLPNTQKITVENLLNITTDDYLNPSFSESTPLKHVLHNFSRKILNVTYTNTFNGVTRTEIKDYILPLGSTTKGILLRKLNEIEDKDHSIFRDAMHCCRENGFFAEAFLKRVDTIISKNSFQFYYVEDIVSIFFDMSYLGYQPTPELCNVLTSTADQIFNQVKIHIEKDEDEELLYKKVNDETSITSSVRRKRGLSIQQTLFELLTMMSIASSSSSSLIDSELYKKSLHYTIECLIYFQYYFKHYTSKDLTPNNYFLLSNPYLKQQLYWSLILRARLHTKDDLALRSIKFLDTFFSKKQKEKPVGYLSSGTDVRMRNSVIDMKKKGELSLFASNINSSSLKTEIDFVCLDKNGSITFFECDGASHFIYPLYLGGSKSVEKKPHLNGQTFFKTAILSLFGSVVRVSSLCSERVYFDRIKNLSGIFSYSNGTFSLIDPENYDGFPSDFFVRLKKKKTTFQQIVPTLFKTLSDETRILSGKQIKSSQEHNQNR